MLSKHWTFSSRLPHITVYCSFRTTLYQAHFKHDVILTHLIIYRPSYGASLVRLVTLENSIQTNTEIEKLLVEKNYRTYGTSIKV